jgi:hypothetical protein
MTRRREERIVEVEMERIEDLLARLRRKLDREDYELLRNLVDACEYVTDLVRDKETSIKKTLGFPFVPLRSGRWPRRRRARWSPSGGSSAMRRRRGKSSTTTTRR